jgi:hypothetical protein
LVPVELSETQNVDSQPEAISRPPTLLCRVPKSTPDKVIEVDPDIGAFETKIENTTGLSKVRTTDTLPFPTSEPALITARCDADIPFTTLHLTNVVENQTVTA